jgi:general secretion pathway protein A
MYREYYHFSENPFDLRPDAKFLYLACSHGEVLSTMMAGIKERKGMIVITGEAGIGKTILIHALLKDLNEKIKTAFIFNPTLDFPSMLATVFHELGLPVNENQEDTPSMLHRFGEYLNQRFIAGEIVTVVIDEAQSLRDDVLENLCLFSDPETPVGKALRIFLIGHPGLATMLDAARKGAINGKVGLQARIKPFNRQEGKRYIHHRLQIVGRDSSEVFTAGAVHQIWKYAKGIPRVMNLICDRSLQIGYRESRPIIDSQIVSQAIAEEGKHENQEYEETEAPPPAGFKEDTHSLAVRIAILLLSLGIFLFTLKRILPLLTG